MSNLPEMWVPPSAEHRRLYRHARWLVAPADGKGPLLGQLLRWAMIAPMTQLTFASFEMQCFLYQVFHLTWAARLGHLFGMTSQILFVLAGGATLPLGQSGLHWGHVFAAGFALWWCGVALAVGLRLWAGVALLLVAGLLQAAEALVPQLTALQVAGGWQGAMANPWLGALASAFVVAVSHAPEPKLPPRAVSGGRWRSVADYVLGQGEQLSLPIQLGRALRVSAFVPLGVLNELWAGLRLMPYGWLMVMFRLGYAPDLWAELQRREAKALASGNPAIDFVGVGGGAMLVDAGDAGWTARPAA